VATSVVVVSDDTAGTEKLDLAENEYSGHVSAPWGTKSQRRHSLSPPPPGNDNHDPSLAPNARRRDFLTANPPLSPQMRASGATNPSLAPNARRRGFPCCQPPTLAPNVSEWGYHSFSNCRPLPCSKREMEGVSLLPTPHSRPKHERVGFSRVFQPPTPPSLQT
jgi:hypothetical protein